VRLRCILACAAALLLVLPGSAFALTDEQFKNLANTKPSGDGTPQVGLNVGGGLVRGVIGFVVVIGAILIIAKLLKTNQKRKNGTYMPRGRGRDGGLVEVISTTPLGPNRQLHLVRIGDEVILVGSGEGGITPLRKFDEDEAIALGVIAPEEQTLDTGFADALAGAGVPVAPRRTSQGSGVLDRVRALTSR
jgi:flagellar protein FliO/FliZ